jgi:hypothetical protein
MRKRARVVTVGSDCHKSMQVSLCDSAIMQFQKIMRSMKSVFALQELLR